MRAVVVALMGLGLAQPALAADLGVLRGSFAPTAAYRNWEGPYAGAAIGIGNGGANLDGQAGALVQQMAAHTELLDQGIQNWTTSGRADTGAQAQYGAFIGYNAQWEDAVVGVEVNYYHTSMNASSGGRTPMDPNSYIMLPWGSTEYSVPTGVSGTSGIKLTDFGTVRARFGWAFDRFLPYLTGGLALGRASYGSTAMIERLEGQYMGTTVPNPPNPHPDRGISTASNMKNGALIYGWSAGLGMDVAVTDDIFVRAEYEYIQFSQSSLTLNSGRIAAGFRF